MNTPEERAAYVNSRAAAAMITALGMVAANKEREARGESQAYPEKAFMDLVTEYGLYHNNIVEILQGLHL